MAFSRLLRLFGDSGYILEGRMIHGKIITSGFLPDVYSNNHLISMYVKFERFNDARTLLARMPERNFVSWTVLISGYSRMGFAEEALDCFRLMVVEGFSPNHYTYVGAISACASLGAVRLGMEIHGRIYRVEQDLNSFMSNCLVNLYAKCGLMNSAQVVFNAILEPNLVSWTSLLSGYCQCGEYEEGLKIFSLSRRSGVKANEFSCASVLGACASLKDLKVGKQVHSYVFKCGIGFDQFISTAIINFYAKCDELDLARQAFLELDRPHSSSWTALIGGCAQQGHGREAIDLFYKLHSSGHKLSDRTFSSVLGAFADAVEIEAGKQLHSLILKLGFNSVTVVGNSVLDFYSKCGLLEESSKVFEEMNRRDVVSWNALISGHVKQGCFGEAIELLNQMLLEDMNPNLYTYSSILSICGDLPATEWGKQTHCCTIKPGFDIDVVVGSALVDMYAKCGRLSDARKVFNNLTSKNLVSWNTMLIGYAQHGFGGEALEIYNKMQRDGIEPNDITFLGVLSACGHVGLVEEGWHHFNSMIRYHGIIPRMDHLACMVNLFARKGQTQRAYEFIRSIPIELDKVVWRCLLSGCKTHKDFALGRYAAEQILRIDPGDTAAYIMLSNVYSEAKMWDEVAQVRKVMKLKGLKKEAGCSWIEMKNRAYFFSVGETGDTHRECVREAVKGLTVQMFDEGYVPNAMFSFHYGE
ncbi:hypothetical protein HHK36_016786 [Tetracentron sinense]|uniref:Pentatricopeptide repeat-containing protein n=1 Tax=Tetracentron sinense TaxID=13715 RepID=A0A835DC89_TETSI|nr:hypothetical protein HHK36_016786 [Tetracentron sinense]